MIKAPEKSSSFRVTTLSPSALSERLRQLWSFGFLILSLFMIWAAYRWLIIMPIWFDELVAKAIVFGLPVVWLAARSRFMAKEIGLGPHQLMPGLFLGLAVGGLYGFVGLLLQISGGLQLVEMPLFVTDEFWMVAGLGLATAWWESLFFYGLPVNYIRQVMPWFSETLLGVVVVAIFILFHIPLRVAVAAWSPAALLQILVLGVFATGQFLLYRQTGNLYAIVLSHLFWGLTLELY